MSIVLFVNPRSRGNLRNPRLAEDLSQALGSAGRVAVPSSLGDLAEEAGRLAQDPPMLIAVHGGDGSLHQVLTALLNHWPQAAPLPPLAILPGGTMNVVASSLGLLVDPLTFLRHLVSIQRGLTTATLIHRRCLHIGSRYGFVFGNGAIAGFLSEYYRTGAYSAVSALWLLARGGVAALREADNTVPWLQGFEGRLVLDNKPQPWTRATALSAGTVREVGLRFKLNHRADEEPDRFPLMVIHTNLRGLLRDIPAVFAGLGMTPLRATSQLVQKARLEPSQPPMAYTIDGDMYESLGPLDVAIGPTLTLVRPPAGRLS